MPKKKSNTPWLRDSNPFAQNHFRLRKLHKGFKERFVENTPDSINKHEDYGRVVAKCTDYGYEPTEKHGTAIIRQGMILMEMPDELAEMRVEYIEEKTKKRTQGTQEQLRSEVHATERKLNEQGLVEVETTII